SSLRISIQLSFLRPLSSTSFPALFPYTTLFRSLEGSVAVYCRLDTRVIPRDALGPFAGLLNPTEPLRIAGPVTIERPGTARFRVEELTLRGIAFPAPMVKQLAQRVAGADSSGAVPLRVSPAFTG